MSASATPPADRVARFQELVAQNPSNELFRFSLAQALIAANRGAEAETHLVFCVQAKKDWMLARIAYGKLLLQRCRSAEAKLWLEEALALAVEQQHETPEAELRALLADL